MRRRHSVLLSLLFLLNSPVPSTAQESPSEDTSRNTRLISELGRLQWSLELLATIDGIDVSFVLKREIRFCLENHTLPPGDLFEQLLSVVESMRLTREEARVFLSVLEASVKSSDDMSTQDDLLSISREVHHEIQNQRIQKTGVYLETLGSLKNTGLLRQKASDIREDFYRARACFAAPGPPINHNMNKQTLDAIEAFLFDVSTVDVLDQRYAITRLGMISGLLEILECTPPFMEKFSFLYREMLGLIEFFHAEVNNQYSFWSRGKEVELRGQQRRSDVLMESSNFVMNPDGTLSIAVPEETVGDRLVLGIRRAWNRYMPVSCRASEHRQEGEKDSWLRRARRVIKP